MSDSPEGMTAQSFEGLPGEEFIRQGLADLAEGVESIPALLVAVGYPRLRGVGIVGEIHVSVVEGAEIRLYRLLSQQDIKDAYSQYNALIRRLVSFERAFERVYWASKRKENGSD